MAVRTMNSDHSSKTPNPDAAERSDAPARERSAGKSAELAMHYCPNCSQRLQDRGCRLRCNRCAYFMDCSDYY